MLIIYGLGNNESKYLDTKHNIGRKVVETIVAKNNLSFTKKNSYYYTKSNSASLADIYFLYSDGYMNDSGRPLVEFCKYNPVDSDAKLVIIHDDSDQIEGNVKLLPQGGSAGHHGINSIYRELLGTPIPIENVWRLKIGIRPPLNKLRSETFVLNRLSKNDELSVVEVSKHLDSALPLIIINEWQKAQTKLNSVRDN